MKKKILIILIILIGLVIGGFFVWKNIFQPEKEFYKGAGIFFIGAAPLGDEYKPVLTSYKKTKRKGYLNNKG